MAYNTITYGFSVSAPDAIDDRLVLTKEQMRLMNDIRMPDVYLAICKDDGLFYLYNKMNPFLEETGKFVLFKVGDGDELPLKVVDHELCCVFDDSL